MKQAADALIALLAGTNQYVMWEQYTVTLSDGSVLTWNSGDQPTEACPPRGAFSAYQMQAWWEFEQNNGTFSLLDSSDAGNNLTTTNATSVITVAGGVSGRAMYRGGEGAAYETRRMYIPRANTHLDFGKAESFTVGCWIKPQALTDTDHTRTIMGRSAILIGGGQAVYTSDSYRLGVLNNVLSWSIATEAATSYRILSGAMASVGTWQFVVGVCDLAAGQLRLYANASAVAGSPLAIPSGPQHCVPANFCISHPMQNDDLGDNAPPIDVEGRQFNGYVDKAFVVPRALTPTEITYLYNAGAGRSFAEALAQGIMVSA